METKRIENHEYENQLITIRGMVSKKNSELYNYLDSILGGKNKTKNLWIDKLKNIPVGGMKGLISYKINDMENANINVSLDVSKNIKEFDFLKLHQEEYKSLCKTLGIFILPSAC
jgi:sensor histidine kinase regulating citrate/malate metabolism